MDQCCCQCTLFKLTPVTMKGLTVPMVPPEFFPHPGYSAPGHSGYETFTKIQML